MLLANSGESLRRKNWSHIFLEDRNGYAAPNLSKKAGTKSIMRFGCGWVGSLGSKRPFDENGEGVWSPRWVPGPFGDHWDGCGGSCLATRPHCQPQ